jgi:hypothetical protein
VQTEKNRRQEALKGKSCLQINTNRATENQINIFMVYFV